MVSETMLLSAGIDIGTTTTQVVFSRLRLQENAAFGRVPALTITDRTIIYESPVHLTPLTAGESEAGESAAEDSAAENSIDAEAVAALVKEDFRQAGVLPEEVETGAVIITGESARKRNAGQVIHAISALAGDFVATEAGPDLESILAGRGAGADHFSETTGKTVLNIDIGGGTSNLCLFQDGRPIACSACNIGARSSGIWIVQPGGENSIRLAGTSVSSTGKNTGENEIWDSAKMSESALSDISILVSAEEVCRRLAAALASIAGLTPMTDFARKLLLPDEGPIPTRADLISFSGGVAACMLEDQKEMYKNPFPYGDLGLLLARAIQKNPYFASVETVCGEETVRATVTGAASFSMEISGNTVFCRDISFPMKNVPVFSIAYDGEASLQILSSELKRISKFADQMQIDHFAIAIKGIFVPCFQEVEKMADAIMAAFAARRTDKDVLRKKPVLVLMESDFAKALGLSLKRRKKTGPILCLDGIAAEDGSYIDIGAPLAGGLAYPVTVKTLIFR